MKRASLIAAVCGLVLTIAGPAMAGSPSCTLKNKAGDSVTVDLGGFGGDNAIGNVLDSLGAGVDGAEVDVYNRNKDVAGNGKSAGRSGYYDIDVNGDPGDVVDVFVKWTDARGGKHEVQGHCTL